MYIYMYVNTSRCMAWEARDTRSSETTDTRTCHWSNCFCNAVLLCVCVCLCKYTWQYACIFSVTHMYTCENLYIDTRVWHWLNCFCNAVLIACVNKYVYVNMYMYIHKCVYVYKYAHIRVLVNIHKKPYKWGIPGVKVLKITMFTFMCKCCLFL